MVICLEQDADLHMAQLMPLPLTVYCFSKIQIGFTFRYWLTRLVPEKRAVMCVCVCVCSHRVLISVSGQLHPLAANATLLAFAAVCRAAAAPSICRDRLISCPPGPQQQTHRMLLQWANGTDRRTDTVPLLRPCLLLYEHRHTHTHASV